MHRAVIHDMGLAGPNGELDVLLHEEVVLADHAVVAERGNALDAGQPLQVVPLPLEPRHAVGAVHGDAGVRARLLEHDLPAALAVGDELHLDGAEADDLELTDEVVADDDRGVVGRAVDAAWAEGRAMTLEQAVQYALGRDTTARMAP